MHWYLHPSSKPRRALGRPARATPRALDLGAWRSISSSPVIVGEYRTQECTYTEWRISSPANQTLETNSHSSAVNLI